MAQSTLTPATTADNPPKDTSNPCVNGLSGSPNHLDTQDGVVPMPAANPTVSFPPRTGSFDMSRRQILSATAMPSAAAMAMVFGPSTTEDDELKLWRDWNRAELEHQAAYDNYWIAADALAADVRPDNFAGYLLQHSQRKAYMAARARCENEGEREFVDATFEPILKGLEHEQHHREVAQAAAGLPALQEAIERCQERADRLLQQIERMSSPSATAIAAKLHVAMRMHHPQQFSEDYPFCLIVSVLRDLVEVLPNDMAAAIRADIAPRTATA